MNCRKISFLVIFIYFLHVIPSTLFAKPKTYKEPEVLAAFIYNIAKFIEWNHEPIIGICVFGEKNVKKYFNLLQGKKINSSKIIIIQPERTVFKKCNIMYFDKSFENENKVADILNRLKKRKIFTTSNIKGFSDKLGILEFYRIKDRIRFKINLKNLYESGIILSSKILELATIVGK